MTAQTRFPQTEILDRARLETFDPQGGRGAAQNRRYLCPLCGEGKPKDAAHRSLLLETGSGLWNCKRCGESGKLRDFWQPRGAGTERVSLSARERARMEAARLIELAPQRESASDDRNHDAATAPASATAKATDWRRHLRGLAPLAGTLGASYLESRGIDLETATLAGVRFSAGWFGRRAVVFPIRNRAGALIAAQGRECGGAAKLTTGPKSRGVFLAPALASGKTFGPLESRGPGVIVCEAPIDALSLAACGFPALALCGVNGDKTTGPPWFHLACGLRRVFLAFDCDDAGEAAAVALASRLGEYGAQCERLSPPKGKDWNDALLQMGCADLTDALAPAILGRG